MRADERDGFGDQPGRIRMKQGQVFWIRQTDRIIIGTRWLGSPALSLLNSDLDTIATDLKNVAIFEQGDVHTVLI